MSHYSELIWYLKAILGMFALNIYMKLLGKSINMMHRLTEAPKEQPSRHTT